MYFFLSQIIPFDGFGEKPLAEEQRKSYKYIKMIEL